MSPEDVIVIDEPLVVTPPERFNISAADRYLSMKRVGSDCSRCGQKNSKRSLDSRSVIKEFSGTDMSFLVVSCRNCGDSNFHYLDDLMGPDWKDKDR